MKTRTFVARRSTLSFALFALLVLVAITFVLLPDDAPSDPSSSSKVLTDEPTTELTTPTPQGAAQEFDQDSAPRELVAPKSLTAKSSAPALEVHVTWDDGAPFPRARLLFTREESLLYLGQTDAAGAFILPAPLTAPTILRIQRGPQLLARLTVQPDATPVELIVPRGASVEGLVTVDQSPPGEPLELTLRASQSLWPPMPNWLYSALWSRGERWMNTGAPLPADALGHFHIDGLEAEWSGWLQASDGFRLLPHGGSLQLESPSHDLLVELTRRPRLFGRVVARDGQPIAGAEIDYTLKEGSSRGNGSEASMRSNHVTTSTNGSFEIFLGPARPTEASLTISGTHTGKTGFAKLEVELGKLEDRDLGDIPLDPTRSVTMRVLSEAGQPVAGALVAFAAGRSEPTDTQGETRLLGLPLEEVDLWADALFFERGGMTLLPEVESPVEMRLQPTAGVEVQFLSAKNEPLGGLQLHVSGEAIFEATVFDSDRAQVKLGATASGGMSMDRSAEGELTFEAHYPTGESGRARVSGLSAGVPITLAARDVASGAATWSQTITLGPGEVRRITARLTDSPITLVGHVVNAAGTPLPGASIAILHPGIENPETFRPDEDGSFRIGPLLSSSVDVWVTLADYAPTAIAGHPTSEPLEVVLDKGRTLRVRAVDPDGRVWPLEWAYPRWKGRMSQRGTPAADGSVLLTAAPTSPSEVVANLAGYSLVAPAPAGAEEIVIPIETPGSASVTWPESTLAELPEDTSVFLTWRGQGEFKCYGWHPLTAPERKASSALLEMLLPGDYALELTWRTPSGEARSVETQMEIEPQKRAEIALAP